MAEDQEQEYQRKDVCAANIQTFNAKIDGLRGDIANIAASISAGQADMRELKAISAKVLSNETRISRLENGEKRQTAWTWKLIFVLIAIAFLGNLPNLLPLIAKAFQ